MTARMFTCPLCQKTESFKAIESNNYSCLTENCLLAERLMIHADFNGSGVVTKIYNWVLESGDILHGSYEILKLLGKGGYGATYLAQDRCHSEQVFTIKEIPRVYCDNEEDAFLMRLDHAAIPRLFKHFNVDEMHYSIMEYIDGENLENLAHNPPKTGHEQLVLKIIDQVCDVLSYVHAEGVIHRDLKPENIIVRRNGSIALIDFGIAKRITSNQGTRHLARAASQFFAPPEQYQTGKGITDIRSDIYSLGALLYFMLTGREPVDARNRRPDEEITPLPRTLNNNISKKIERVIIIAMAMEPDNRYDTIAQFKNDLLDSGAPTAKICPRCGQLFRGSRLICRKCGGPTHPLGAAEHAPFVFRSGGTASNLREFIRACYKNWHDAVWHLYQGDFEPWLFSIQEGALADRAANISKYIDNRDEGLNQFLMSCPFGIAPKLELNHNQIDFLSLKQGTQKSVSIKISNSGQGYLTGEIKLTNSYCSLSNRIFSCFAGETQQVRLTIDANKLPAYRDIKSNLVLESNVGSKVIPITVSTEVPTIQWKVEPTALHFQLKYPKPVVKGISIEVTSSHGKLSGTVSPSTDWIRVKPTKFDSRNQLVSVEIAPNELQPGNYKGDILIKSNAGRKKLDVFLVLKTAQKQLSLPPQLQFAENQTDETLPIFHLGKLYRGMLYLALAFSITFLAFRWQGPLILNYRPDTGLVLGFVLLGGLLGVSKKMIKILQSWLAGLVVGLITGLVCATLWKFIAKNIYLLIHHNIVIPLISLFHTRDLMPLSYAIFGLIGCYIGALIALIQNTYKFKSPFTDVLIYLCTITLFTVIGIFLVIYLIPLYF